MDHVDILIQNGTVITMDNARAIIQNGCVAVKKNKIVFVGSCKQALEEHIQAHLVIDVQGAFILPGFINGHTHAGMSFFRGSADDAAKEAWLKEHVFPLEKKFVNADFVYWSTLLSCYEMIKSGITTFVDMYYYEEAVARAVEVARMRAILGQTVLQEEDCQEAEQFIERYKGHDCIVPTVAPHSPYLCSSKTLQTAALLACRYHVPLVMHVAETREEVLALQKQHGLTPFMYLKSLGLTEQPLIAAHAVHVSSEDRNCIVTDKVGIIYNATSNMKLVSGIAPIQQLLEEGALVGIGTDGCASNNSLDMVMEMKVGSLLQKIGTGNAAALPAVRALEMATIQGAQAIGMEKVIGSLEVGKRADIVVMCSNALHQLPSYEHASQIVFASKASDVQTVLIDGVIVMKDKKVTEPNQIGEMYRKTLDYADQIRLFRGKLSA